MSTFADPFNVDTPAPSGESRRQGDDRIRELKRAILERMLVEHDFDVTTGAGLKARHKFPYSTAKPSHTDVSAGAIAFQDLATNVPWMYAFTGTGWSTVVGGFEVNEDFPSDLSPVPTSFTALPGLVDFNVPFTPLTGLINVTLMVLFVTQLEIQLATTEKGYELQMYIDGSPSGSLAINYKATRTGSGTTTLKPWVTGVIAASFAPTSTVQFRERAIGSDIVRRTTANRSFVISLS